jgi:hypothetical protein
MTARTLVTMCIAAVPFGGWGACASQRGDQGSALNGADPVNLETGDVPLSFQGITYQELWGPCESASACSRTFEIWPDRRVSVVDKGNRFSGSIGTSDFQLLVAQAVSRQVLDAMQTQSSCVSAPDGSESLRIDVAHGVFLERETTSCSNGALNWLKHTVKSLVKKAIPELNIQAGAEPSQAVDFAPQERLRIEPGYTSLVLETAHDTCSDVGFCRDSREIFPGQGAIQRLGRVRKQWTDITDFSSLTGPVEDPSLWRFLLTPGSCAGVPGTAETLTIGVGKAIFVGGEITGCGDGPVHRLRTAVLDFFSRLQ